MRWLVVVAACSASAPIAQAPKAIEPTGPELVTMAPGATAFAIDGSDIFWLGSGVWHARAGSATRVADGDDAPTIAIDRHFVYWMRDFKILRMPTAGGDETVMIDTDQSRNFEGRNAGKAPIRTFAVKDGDVDTIEGVGPDSWWLRDGAIVIAGENPLIAKDSNVVVGTSMELVQGGSSD